MKKDENKTNKDYFKMNVSEDYLKERVKFICGGDKHAIPLRNLIGKAHGWDKDKVEKKRYTKEFGEFVLSYLKN